MSQSSLGDLPVLSDYDVQILYEIISIAESSNYTPFRALFAAYDEVLAEHGISPERDRTYFRFLLRMGGSSTGSCNLFEQFEALLRRLGIQVDFGAESADPTANPNIFPPGANVRVITNAEDLKRSRRASFESAYEATIEQLRARSHLNVVLPSRSRSHDSPHRLAAPQRSDVASIELGKGKREKVVEHTGRLRSGYGHKVSLTHANKDHGRKPQPLLVPEVQNHDLGPSEDEDDERLHRGRVQPSSQALPQVNGKQLAEMHAYAEAFRVRKIISISRGFLHKTHDQMVALGSMSRLARNSDAETLLHQAFEQWQARSVNKRSLAETERFFAELDLRAQRARDLFLLTKAFTHWATCTSEELARKSAARRNMLMARCFIAWKDITVVNELKTQRFRLTKIFHLWRERVKQVTTQQLQAQTYFIGKLASHFYRRWFWQFCEHRAPIWHNSKMRYKVFVHWVDRCHARVEDKDSSRSMYDLRLLQKSYLSWSSTCKTMLSSRSEAVNFRNWRLLAPVTQYLKRQSSLLTARKQVQQLVATRIARVILQQCVATASAVSTAEHVCKLRIIRTAWTAWNDRLRCQALSKTIDDRVVIRSLYQWVLMERLQLCKRVRMERLQRSAFGEWRGKTEKLRSVFEEVKSVVNRRHTTHQKLQMFQCWTSRYRSQAQNIILANHQWSNRARLVIFGTWTTRYELANRMNRQARDARYYVLATHTLENWRNAVTTRRKDKRREAYAVMRRKTKIALTRRVLSGWRSASARLIQFRKEATEMNDYHVLRVKRHVFLNWYDTYETLAQIYQAGQDMDVRHLSQNALASLRTRYEAFKATEQAADEFAARVLDTTTVRVFRDMNWRLFQITRQQETADSLEDRNRKKHYRNMLRYWAEKSKFASSTKPTIYSLTNRLEAEVLVPLKDSLTINTLDNGIAAAPIERQDRTLVLQTPGYLRTPSRRTAKSRTRFVNPSTPATTQITPFMNKLWNLQTPGIHIRSARADFARRLMDERKPFDDINETSPLGSEARLD